MRDPRGPADATSTAPAQPNRVGLRSGQISELTVIVPLKAGKPLPDGVCDDDHQARGTFFIFMSATAPETYEFLKKEWIDSGTFIGLGPERDPVVGAHDGHGEFTIPMRPLRIKVPILESFTRTLGGEYAFMPSLSALAWLGGLPASAQA